LHDLNRVRQIERTAHNVAQRAGIDVFHHDVDDLAYLIEVIDRQNVGMIEAGYGTRFLIEAIEKTGFVDEVRGKDLDRDVAIEFLLIRFVDRGCRAARHARLDAVLT
jgi:hypothetical protein